MVRVGQAFILFNYYFITINTFYPTVNLKSLEVMCSVKELFHFSNSKVQLHVEETSFSKKNKKVFENTMFNKSLFVYLSGRQVCLVVPCAAPSAVWTVNIGVEILILHVHLHFCF